MAKLGVNIVKYLTLGLNLLFMLTGVLLIAFGGYAVDRGTIPGLSSKTIASAIIVLGVFVFLVSLAGFWGAIRENRFLLMVYFGVVLLFVIIEFSVGIAAYVKKEHIPTIADQSWSLLFESERSAIEDIEKTFSCCGWNSTSDRAVPPDREGDIDTCVEEYPTFTKSCNETLIDTLESSLAVAGGAAIAIAVIQVICLIFSCYLFVQIPKHRSGDAQELVDDDNM